MFPPPPPFAAAGPRKPPVYTDAQKRAELARRAGVRAALLDGLPPPDAPYGGDRGTYRADLWPPAPAHPADAAAPRDRWGGGTAAGTWTADKLAALVAAFAAARGPDFSKDEFLKWAGVGCGTVNRYCGSWRAARLAAGLPPRPARGSRGGDTLHRLLRVLHLNRHRRRPLGGPELARAAGLSVGAVDRFGGVKHLRDLYRLWAARPRPAGPNPPASSEAALPATPSALDKTAVGEPGGASPARRTGPGS